MSREQQRPAAGRARLKNNFYDIGEFLNTFIGETRRGVEFVGCWLDFERDLLKMDKPRHRQDVLRGMILPTR